MSSIGQTVHMRRYLYMLHEGTYTSFITRMLRQMLFFPRHSVVLNLSLKQPNEHLSGCHKG